jgi:uncharacterized damage-inducible protein DinB
MIVIAASSAATESPAPPSSCLAIAAPLARTLRDLRSLLSAITQTHYTARAGELFAHSSVGGHVRHVLDHARALADSFSVAPIDYDTRARGTTIETDLAAADAELARLVSIFDQLGALDADFPVTVRVLPSKDAQPLSLSSTLARELAFVLSHTIHHNATIRSMLLALGCGTPESFGYAPSTLAHMHRAASTNHHAHAQDHAPCVR